MKEEKTMLLKLYASNLRKSAELIDLLFSNKDREEIVEILKSRNRV